jgi:general secretion pathway protein A
MGGRRLLKIFFVGQTEFNEMLLDKTNTAVRKEIVAGYHIEPLTENETGQYINHRLQVAGATEDIFSNQCRRKIHSITRGFPRLINILCDHALLTGYVDGVRRIEAKIIERCEKNNELPISLAHPPQDENRLIPDWNKKNGEVTQIKYKSRKPWIWIILVISLTLCLAGYLVSQDNAFDALHHAMKNLFTQIREQVME